MRRNRRRWILVAAAGVAIVALLALLFTPRAVPVDIGRSVRGPIDETVQDQGTARVREAYIVAAPVAGRLERIELHVGDRVQAGRTILARIHPAAPELLDPRARAQAVALVAAASASASAAWSTHERAAAEARRADLALGRTRTLVEKGYGTRRGLDDAEADARAAHAALAAAEGEYQARKAQLAAARAALVGPGAVSRETIPVTAPASGYVTRVLQESERSVLTGAPLVEISENRGLEAQIEFLSQDAVKIREGMPAEIYDWGGPGVIRASVRRVEPEGYVKISALGVEEHRALVMLQFDDPPQKWASLAPGYGLWARVFLRRETAAVKVPLGALVGAGGGWAVFRIEDGRARLTPVKVGAVTDREAEIRSGLAPAAQVVLFPSDRVRDGVRVAARRP